MRDIISWTALVDLTCNFLWLTVYSAACRRIGNTHLLDIQVDIFNFCLASGKIFSWKLYVERPLVSLLPPLLHLGNDIPRGEALARLRIQQLGFGGQRPLLLDAATISKAKKKCKSHHRDNIDPKENLTSQRDE